jgi:parallel beta-helix repeat protein
MLRFTKRLLEVATVVVGLTLAVFATDAHAATCKVKNGPPSGANNFATIQAAIADPSCTTIKVKAGSYAGPITVNRSLTLMGQSKVNTIINLAGNTNPTLGAIVAVVAPATNVTIDNFTITGPGAGGCGSLQYGILVRDAATATIQNNHITAIRDNPMSGCQNGNAIQVGREALATIGHATIRRNTIDDYQKTGIVVDGRLTGPVSTAAITENTIKGDVNGACFPNYRCGSLAAQNGIQVSRKAMATVTGNTITENRYNPAVAASGGILLYNAGETTVKSNTMDRNDVGVWVLDTSNADVLSNRVKNSTYDGVAVQAGSGTAAFNTISSNVADLNGNGIGLYATTTNTVDHNVLSRNDGPGIFVDDDATGNFFLSNKLKKNVTYGIEDQSTGGGTGGTGNSYSSNVCTGNGTAPSTPPNVC